MAKAIKDFIQKPGLLFVSLGHRGWWHWMDDETYLKIAFRSKMGKKLHLDNPQSYSEKLQWIKLYDRKPEYTAMVDKYEAKKIAAQLIGDEYIIPTLGVWDRFEDIDFDFETMNDEELEKAFADKFETSEETPVEENAEEPEENNEEFADDDDEDGDEDGGEDDDYTGDDEVTPKKYSIEMSDGTVKEFALSLQDKISALDTLVNETYSETDNDYYSVDVYESEKSVVMVGWWSGKAYKQSYKVRNDVYTLTGDRVAVKPVYLTADEEAELDKMRSNYSSISEKLEKYESEPKKVEVLNSDDYANIADVEEFVELKKQENHFDLSVDEVTERANEILLDYAKHNSIKFSEDSEKKLATQKKLPTAKKNKTSRYGNLFSKR